MEEMLKFMQSSNGAFKSELMKSFIAKHRGEGYPQAPAPGGYNQNLPTSPFFPTGNTSTTTTTSITAATTLTLTSTFPPSATTGSETTPATTVSGPTDNANILLQKLSLTDNNQPEAAPSSATTTAPADLIDNQTAPSPAVIAENNGNDTNANANANANRNAAATTPKPTSPPQQQQPQSASPFEPDPNANVREVNAALEEVRGALSEGQQLLLAEVTEATVDAHLATCLNTHQAVREATARFAALQESGQLPDMSKMSQSASSMWHRMTEQMMPEMGKTMRFCRMLPGFNELSQADQMKLIKLGMFEVMMTRFALLIDHEKETMLDPSHKMVCPRQVVTQMPMGTFLNGFFHVGAQFNPLGLTDGEIGLFTALLVFCPSRPGLQDVKLISAIQSLYQRALYHLIKTNHSDPEGKFRKVLGLVPMFHRMSDEHNKALGLMQMQEQESYAQQFPPMHREFYPTVKQEAQ